MEAMMELLSDLLIILIVGVIIIYVIEGLILNTLNKKIYGEGTWQAWVPFANIYLLGKLTVNKTVGWILLIMSFVSNGDEGVWRTLKDIYGIAVFVLFIYAIIKIFQIKNGTTDINRERIRIDGANAVINNNVGGTDNTTVGGNPATPGTKYCPSCGALQESAAKFCTNCGSKLQ